MLVLGCGHPGPPHVVPEPIPPGPSSACLLGTPGVPAPDTITVVVADSDSAAAAAANDFDTLIRLDCEGRPMPGLASSWSRDSTGTNWTFVFPDSQVPGAGDVASAWKSGETALALLSQSGVREAVPDGQRLVIRLEQPAKSVPVIFADHALGVRHHPSPPTIVVHSTEGRDVRDLVDQSPDVLVTEDPDVLDYASRRPGTTLTPLAWDRVYVLLLAPDGRPPRELITSDSTTFRMQLARDAVRSEARPAQPPYWWSGLHGCAASATRVAVQVRPGAEVPIGYPAGDAAARSLAERIVALGDGSWFARGLAAHEFETSLRVGAMNAYILPLPIRPLVPCRETTWPAGAILVPLVETRRTAILRQNGPALVVGGDGSVRPGVAPGRP